MPFEQTPYSRLMKGAFPDTAIQVVSSNQSFNIALGTVTNNNFSYLGVYNIGLLIQSLQLAQELDGRDIRIAIGTPKGNTAGPLLMGIGVSSTCVLLAPSPNIPPEELRIQEDDI